MQPKKYYWLKLKDDFFNQREIKKLRKIAGGDTYTIIYLKLQLLGIKTGGILFYEKTEENFEEQIALELDEDIQNVKMTLLFLETNNLMEVLSEVEYFLPKVCENIGKESDSAERMRRMRSKKALQSYKPPSHCYTDVTISDDEVTKSDTDVTKSDTEKEIEIEIDKDKDKKKKKNEEEGQDPPDEPRHKIIIEYLNKKTNRNYRYNSSANKKFINARLNENYTVDDFKKVIDNKTKEWMNDRKFSKFLRPETLFGNKFDAYLNQEQEKKTDWKEGFFNG